MEKLKFAEGVFITEKKSKEGNPYLTIAVKDGDTYKKYIAFKSSKEGKFGGTIYSVYDAEKKDESPF
jgi:hypothetical protein